MRLKTGDTVTVTGLPGTWTLVHTLRDHRGWWQIVPKFTTEGLALLCSYGTVEAHRENLSPLHQETLL